ncbi:hypothetical protein GCM10017600_47220 [Streptosporangium carneum]|uniref:Uncharacterized protein n=1 Tax=Streptosporangium carneum TaxID=47481 RepID=A0A9W6I5H5_9ACTN|nr:hypothetical protein GCM10017600_47220 [Streptosporangium carneum]
MGSAPAEVAARAGGVTITVTPARAQTVRIFFTQVRRASDPGGSAFGFSVIGPRTQAEDTRGPDSPTGKTPARPGAPAVAISLGD